MVLVGGTVGGATSTCAWSHATTTDTSELTSLIITGTTTGPSARLAIVMARADSAATRYCTGVAVAATVNDAAVVGSSLTNVRSSTPLSWRSHCRSWST